MRLARKIHGKLLQIFLVIRSRILSIYRSLSTHVIQIDGGLGSQIMQFALYSRIKFEGKRAVLDPTYYRSQENRVDNSLVTTHPWELDIFGHYLTDFDSPRRKRLRDSDFIKLYLPFYRRLLKDDKFLKDNFTSKETEVSVIRDKLNLREEELSQVTVVHIRQGDFLKVASFTLSEDYYLEALSFAQQLSRFNIKKIVIVSDEVIEPSRWPRLYDLIKAKSKDQEFLTLIGYKPSAVHEFMRVCGVLICSNSNFSFSAAMMRGEKPSIYPSKFYEGETAALNLIFKLPFGVELQVT